MSPAASIGSGGDPLSGVTELGLAYAALIGLLGAYVYRLVTRLADVDARLTAVEDTVSAEENE